MAGLDERNLARIEELNQRGGRTLSIVDLVEAGTMSAELCAFLLAAVRSGASFITGAVPGGAGKSTVLANLLAFLPPGEELVCVSSPSVLADARKDGRAQGRCFLPHEIGAGPHYGYLWGPAVADWVGLDRLGARIASCIHSDTLDGMRHTLLSPPLSVPPAELGRVRLALFLRVGRSRGGTVHRVAQVHYARPGTSAHELVYAWDADTDRIEQAADLGLPEAALSSARDTIDRVLREGVRDFAQVRQRLLTSPPMAAGV